LGLAAARLCKGRFAAVYTKHCFDGDLWCNHLQINPRFHWFFQSAAAIIEKLVVAPIDAAIYHFEGTAKIRNPGLLEKFTFAPPPINCRFMTEGSLRNGWHDGSKLTIGFCGRLDPEKGLEDLFAAADIYGKTYGGPKLRLLLIGDGIVGRRLAEGFPELDVTITGFVDDVIPRLDSMDAFVLASRTETTSLSSLEAYARNLPIFSRPVGFLGMNPGRYRHVYNFSDPAELAALIHRVMQPGLALRRTVGALPDPSLITFSQLYDQVAEKYYQSVEKHSQVVEKIS
jgi:glycosyltransferase involved in cell wall biosynthesis